MTTSTRLSQGDPGRRGGKPTLGPDPFVVELDRFHGPLDLLLHLIRSQDIDVFDIPIARITQQFQTALGAGLEDLELDRAGEFLEMASTLVRIKAQMLLPRNESPEWEEDPRADLVRRLLEYEYFQEVARVLMSAEADRSRHFPKGYVPPRPPPEEPAEELELTLEGFLDGAGGVPEPRQETLHRAPTRKVSVKEKVSLARRLLRKARRILFDRLFEEWRDRFHAVASLLASLELARQQVIRIEQSDQFGEIWLFRGERFAAEEDENGDGTGEPAGGSGSGAEE